MQFKNNFFDIKRQTSFENLLFEVQLPQNPLFLARAGFSSYKWKGTLCYIRYNSFIRNEYLVYDTGFKESAGSGLSAFSSWKHSAGIKAIFPRTISFRTFFFKKWWYVGPKLDYLDSTSFSRKRRGRRFRFRRKVQRKMTYSIFRNKLLLYMNKLNVKGSAWFFVKKFAPQVSIKYSFIRDGIFFNLDFAYVTRLLDIYTVGFKGMLLNNSYFGFVKSTVFLKRFLILEGASVGFFKKCLFDTRFSSFSALFFKSFDSRFNKLLGCNGRVSYKKQFDLTFFSSKDFRMSIWLKYYWNLLRIFLNSFSLQANFSFFQILLRSFLKFLTRYTLMYLYRCCFWLEKGLGLSFDWLSVLSSIFLKKIELSTLNQYEFTLKTLFDDGVSFLAFYHRIQILFQNLPSVLQSYSFNKNYLKRFVAELTGKFSYRLYNYSAEILLNTSLVLLKDAPNKKKIVPFKNVIYKYITRLRQYSRFRRRRRYTVFRAPVRGGKAFHFVFFWNLNFFNFYAISRQDFGFKGLFKKFLRFIMLFQSFFIQNHFILNYFQLFISRISGFSRFKSRFLASSKLFFWRLLLKYRAFLRTFRLFVSYFFKKFFDRKFSQYLGVLHQRLSLEFSKLSALSVKTGSSCKDLVQSASGLTIQDGSFGLESTDTNAEKKISEKLLLRGTRGFFYKKLVRMSRHRRSRFQFFRSNSIFWKKRIKKQRARRLKYYFKRFLKNPIKTKFRKVRLKRFGRLGKWARFRKALYVRYLEELFFVQKELQRVEEALQLNLTDIDNVRRLRVLKHYKHLIALSLKHYGQSLQISYKERKKLTKDFEQKSSFALKFSHSLIKGDSLIAAQLPYFKRRARLFRPGKKQYVTKFTAYPIMDYAVKRKRGFPGISRKLNISRDSVSSVKQVLAPRVRVYLSLMLIFFFKKGLCFFKFKNLVSSFSNARDLNLLFSSYKREIASHNIGHFSVNAKEHQIVTFINNQCCSQVIIYLYSTFRYLFSFFLKWNFLYVCAGRKFFYKSFFKKNENLLYVRNFNSLQCSINFLKKKLMRSPYFSTILKYSLRNLSKSVSPVAFYRGFIRYVNFIVKKKRRLLKLRRQVSRISKCSIKFFRQYSIEYKFFLKQYDNLNLTGSPFLFSNFFFRQGSLCNLNYLGSVYRLYEILLYLFRRYPAFKRTNKNSSVFFTSYFYHFIHLRKYAALFLRFNFFLSVFRLNELNFFFKLTRSPGYNLGGLPGSRTFIQALLVDSLLGVSFKGSLQAFDFFSNNKALIFKTFLKFVRNRLFVRLVRPLVLQKVVYPLVYRNKGTLSSKQLSLMHSMEKRLVSGLHVYGEGFLRKFLWKRIFLQNRCYLKKAYYGKISRKDLHSWFNFKVRALKVKYSKLSSRFRRRLRVNRRRPLYLRPRKTRYLRISQVFLWQFERIRRRKSKYIYRNSVARKIWLLRKKGKLPRRKIRRKRKVRRLWLTRYLCKHFMNNFAYFAKIFVIFKCKARLRPYKRLKKFCFFSYRKKRRRLKWLSKLFFLIYGLRNLFFFKPSFFFKKFSTSFNRHSLILQGMQKALAVTFDIKSKALSGKELSSFLQFSTYFRYLSRSSLLKLLYYHFFSVRRRFYLNFIKNKKFKFLFLIFKNFFQSYSSFFVKFRHLLLGSDRYFLSNFFLKWFCLYKQNHFKNSVSYIQRYSSVFFNNEVFFERNPSKSINFYLNFLFRSDFLLLTFKNVYTGRLFDSELLFFSNFFYSAEGLDGFFFLTKKSFRFGKRRYWNFFAVRPLLCVLPKFSAQAVTYKAPHWFFKNVARGLGKDTIPVRQRNFISYARLRSRNFVFLKKFMGYKNSTNSMRKIRWVLRKRVSPSRLSRTHKETPRESLKNFSKAPDFKVIASLYANSRVKNLYKRRKSLPKFIKKFLKFKGARAFGRIL